MGPADPRRRDDEDERLAGWWGEGPEGFLTRYLPYAVGLTLAMGILWWGAMPQFRAAGLGGDTVAAAAAGAAPAAAASATASGSAAGSSSTSESATTPASPSATESAASTATGATSTEPSVTASSEPSASPSAEPTSSAAGGAASTPAAAVVAASSNGIVLTGTVASQKVHQDLVAAARQAAEAAGIGTVDDRLSVAGSADGAAVTYTGSLPATAAAALRSAGDGLASTDGLQVTDQLTVAASAGSSAQSVAAQINALLKANPVLFASGKATIRPESRAVLDKMAVLLKSSPVHVEIRGYTDSQGAAADNLTLSRQRAAAVKNYLVAKGVSAKQLSVRGFGEADPVASNDTAQGRQLNRRIVVIADS